MAVLQQIFDRRLSGKNKSVGNRERFLRRYRGQIREAVRKAVTGRNIRELEQGEDVTLPRRDVSEPTFGHAQGGNREYVHPGNQEYVKGDRIERPKGQGGGGSGSGEASDSGEGEEVHHLGGRYVDTLIREHGQWRIKDRLTVRDWSVGHKVERDYFREMNFIPGVTNGTDVSFRALGLVHSGGFGPEAPSPADRRELA